MAEQSEKLEEVVVLFLFSQLCAPEYGHTVLHSKRVDFFLNLHADLISTAGN